jgi:hypothetical protein
MSTGIQITFDCADPGALSRFWAETLHYQLDAPPEGFDTWEAALESWGVPKEDWNSASAVVDPEGKGPRIFFQRVPEPKAVKNRVHLDLYVSAGPGTPPDERKADIEPEAERLVALGAERVEGHEKLDEYFVVMRDPEGNEFCVC